MSPNYNKILEPLSVGGLDLANRVIMLPMGTGMQSSDGWFSDQEIAYFTERAIGGTALITTSAAPVSIDFEPPSPALTGVYSDDALPSMTRLVEFVHAAGSKLSFQLTPGLGRNAAPGTPEMPPICPSAVPAFGAPDVICRALETGEVKLLVQRMAEAAVRAHKAGADAVDIHGHTGYLVDQFLSAQWNVRDDEYGGSLENRCRFAVEIIRAIKEAVPSMPVSFRLSVEQRFPGGRTTEESLEIAKILEEAGLDFILADDGSYEAMDYVFPPYYMGDASLLSAAKAVKSVVSIPVVACGSLDPATAAQVLEDGDADLIGVGRGLIADPYFVAKLAAGTPEQIRPCIRCNAMCVGGVLTGQHLACAVNPEAGFELERQIALAETRQKVVIVGGGPAGLEAARVAALEGHEVDVYERADRVGGVLLPAAKPEFKRELHRMIGWWEGQLDGLPVRVHLGHEVTPDDPVLQGADRILVGTGSFPIVPSGIPGIDAPNVVDVIEAHDGAPLGTRVVVAGGGLSGADLALELAQNGHQVTIVEMMDDIARDMLPLNKLSLMRELGEAGVEIRTSHMVTAIGPDGVTATAPDGGHLIPADTVVLAFGVKPNDTLAQQLRERGLPVEAIGDCVQPAKVGEAIHSGYLAASRIGQRHLHHV